MASYLNPQPSNAILDDITNIRELENYNAQSDPSLGTGFPVGAKRFINVGSATAPQWQWQRYDGTSWKEMANTATEKLMHNVDMLDGYHVSTSAEANKIPVYNAQSLLVGGITGNAATATQLKTARKFQVGGIASGDEKLFDGTAAVTLLINSIDVNNEADDAIEGVLTPKHGGTGRQDGAAQDVRVTLPSGEEVSAKAYGQVGRAKSLGNTHLDTVIVDGFYVGGTNSAYHSEEYGYPQTNSNSTFLRVISADKYILQILETNAELWRRTSTNSGASWHGWLSSGGTHGATIRLYVSKSGSDFNTGLSADTPLQSISKAIRIASGMSSGLVTASVQLMLGEGDWGNVTFRSLPFWLDIFPYDGSTPTAYSESLPKFGDVIIRDMNVGLYGLVANTLIAQWNAYVAVIIGYKRIGSVIARDNSVVYFNSQNAVTNVWEITGDSTQNYVLNTFTNSYIFMEYLHLRLAENVSKTAFFSVAHTGTLSVYKGRTLYDASAYTFTGKKSILANAAVVTTNEDAGVATFFTDVLPGTEAEIRDGAIINGWVANDSRVVHLTGDETITGTKTFESSLFVTGASTTAINISNNTFTRGDEITSTQYHQFNLLDNQKVNDVKHRFGSLEWGITNTAVTAYLRAYKNVTDGGTNAFISVVHPNEGVPYATAPSTPDGSTDNKIVTADYLAAQGGIGGIAKVLGAPDANTLLTPGFYWMTSTATNIPSGVNGLLCVYGTTSIVRQVFYRQGTLNSNDHNIWTRQIIGIKDGVAGTIGDWVQILTGKGGTIKSTAPRLSFSDTEITRNVLPDATHSSGIIFRDSASTEVGNLLHSVYAAGGAKIEIAAFNWMGSGSAALGVAYGAKKGPYAYAPTPLAESNTNDIATTSWCRARNKWTYKNKAITTDGSVGKRTLDFSSYLPADEEEYEVLLRIHISRSDSSSTNTQVIVYVASGSKYMWVQADGANFQQAEDSTVCPVPASHQLQYEVKDYGPSTFEIYALGYRKA